MKRWVNLVISILLLATLLLAHGYVVRGALAALPDAALASASPPVPVHAFAALDTPVSPLLARDGYAGTQSVTAYYTTADAPALFGLTLQYGAFAPWEDGSIVISSELAVSLFLTEYAVGQTVVFGGREYTVCGVYAQPDTLLARVSQTPAPAVFLPLMAYPDWNVMVGEILVGLAGAPSTASVAAALESQLDVRLTFRSAYHFGETRRLAQQSEALLGLLLALVLCVLSAWCAGRRTVGLAKLAKVNTYRAVLAGHREDVIFCVASLLCFAAGVFWLSRSTFTLFLPQDYIMNDGGIVDYLIGNYQLGNLKSSVFLCAFSSNVKTVLALLDICIAVILLKIVYRGKRAIDDLQDAVWLGFN